MRRTGGNIASPLVSNGCLQWNSKWTGPSTSGTSIVSDLRSDDLYDEVAFQAYNRVVKQSDRCPCRLSQLALPLARQHFIKRRVQAPHRFTQGRDFIAHRRDHHELSFAGICQSDQTVEEDGLVDHSRSLSKQTPKKVPARCPILRF